MSTFTGDGTSQCAHPEESVVAIFHRSEERLLCMECGDEFPIVKEETLTTTGDTPQ